MVSYTSHEADQWIDKAVERMDARDDSSDFSAFEFEVKKLRRIGGDHAVALVIRNMTARLCSAEDELFKVKESGEWSD